MKKIWMMTLLCAAVTPACGELLSEVTYNPSRMGTYDYLKVTDRAGLEGGLQVNQLNLRSGGEIGLNKGSNISYYTVTDVKGASGSSVDMPNASFHGNGESSPSNYTASSSSYPTYQLSKVNIKGGEMSFSDDSFMGTVNAVNRLKQYAGNVSGGNLIVGGDGGAGIGLYNGGSTAGFYLSGNDIPVPVGKYVNGNKTLKSCKLAWEERTLSAGGKAKVLALQGCTATDSGSGSGGGTGNTETYSYKITSTETRSSTSATSPFGECTNSTFFCSSKGISVGQSCQAYQMGGGICYICSSRREFNAGIWENVYTKQGVACTRD